MPPLERSTIATCAEVALVVVPLLILLLKAAGELLACVLPVPPRAEPMICYLPVLTEKRKKTDNPREGWEDGTPPPHRDFKERGVVH